MLKATLDAVARARLSEFRVHHHHQQHARSRPTGSRSRSIAATLGERFKFVREDKVDGFKAGALRLALAHTAPDAEIIGVIDADYVVAPGLAQGSRAGSSPIPKVGLVQAPQDHRDGDRSVMHYAMNGEYAGFFDIGMVQRNENNAIIVHGTMCLIRRAALDAAGSWSSDTICEDTDLGLTILELGWLAHYTNRRYGYRPPARHLRRLQEAASPLGLWRRADRQEALAPLPAGREPAYRASRSANSRSAG